tara:strand:- start:758 stop:1048 length:291 start_codon:yes stop_codon:yes gene_type:complete
MAQVDSTPVANAIAGDGISEYDGTFPSVPEQPLELELQVPSPHCPWVLTPQQLIDPLSSKAHVCQLVPSISDAVLPSGNWIFDEFPVTSPFWVETV